MSDPRVPIPNAKKDESAFPPSIGSLQKSPNLIHQQQQRNVAAWQQQQQQFNPSVQYFAQNNPQSATQRPPPQLWPTSGAPQEYWNPAPLPTSHATTSATQQQQQQQQQLQQQHLQQQQLQYAQRAAEQQANAAAQTVDVWSNWTTPADNRQAMNMQQQQQPRKESESSSPWAVADLHTQQGPGQGQGQGQVQLNPASKTQQMQVQQMQQQQRGDYVQAAGSMVKDVKPISISASPVLMAAPSVSSGAGGGGGTSPQVGPRELRECLRLLRQSGYESVAAAIEQDASLGELGASGNALGEKMKSTAQGAKQMFLSAARRMSAKENPLASFRNFCVVYQSFSEWSMKATETVAFALKEISFIIFVELWARLLTLSLKKAAVFLKKFGDGHFITHHHQISEMRRVKSFTALRDTPFVARILRGEKFTMKVDYLTRKLLTTRLTLENDTVVLDILQKRVSFETPGETSAEASLAVLASQAFRAPGSRDVATAVITPSLTLLCGLPAAPSGAPPNFKLEKLKPFLPEPQATTLAKQLLPLYRLPIMTPNDDTHKPAATGDGSSSGIEWRVNFEARRRWQNFYNRAEVNGEKLPSILCHRLGSESIRSELSPPPTDSVEFDCFYANGSTVAATVTRTNCIWVWDTKAAAWNRCVNLIKKSLTQPWLRNYAIAKPPGFDQNGEMSDLDAAGVTFSFDGQDVSIENSALDIAMQTLQEKNGENEKAPSCDELFEQLNVAGLEPRPSQGICLSGHGMTVTSFCTLPPFLSGGAFQLGLSGSYDGKINLWDIKNAFPMVIYRSGSAVNDVVADPYGYLFLSGHQDRAACLWTMDRNSPLRVLNRHSGQVEKVQFHPNSLLLATGASDENRVRLWDHRIPDIVGVISNIRCPRCIEFSPNGRLLALSGSGSSKIQIWDLVAGALLTTISVESSPDSEHFATSLSFSQGTTLLATTNTTGALQLWDLKALASPMKETISSTSDLCGFEENKEFMDNLTDQTSRGKVAEYYYQNAKARQARFDERNVLMVVTEHQAPRL